MPGQRLQGQSLAGHNALNPVGLNRSLGPDPAELWTFYHQPRRFWLHCSPAPRLPQALLPLPDQPNPAGFRTAASLSPPGTAHGRAPRTGPAFLPPPLPSWNAPAPRYDVSGAASTDPDRATVPPPPAATPPPPGTAPTRIPDSAADWPRPLSPTPAPRPLPAPPPTRPTTLGRPPAAPTGPALPPTRSAVARKE